MAVMTKQTGWQAQIETVLDRLSLQWLNDNQPELAEAIDVAVANGASAGEIRRLVMAQTQRLELALRCEQAARALRN